MPKMRVQGPLYCVISGLPTLPTLPKERWSSVRSELWVARALGSVARIAGTWSRLPTGEERRWTCDRPRPAASVQLSSHASQPLLRPDSRLDFRSDDCSPLSEHYDVFHLSPFHLTSRVVTPRGPSAAAFAQAAHLVRSQDHRDTAGECCFCAATPVPVVV
ncbi:hypothetical protein LZ30DRAFT_693961 [Colletotrichum cereale]|nr:hypothetical protein LZ30DRAFT_693961 [Colletotrichum cereale]